MIFEEALKDKFMTKGLGSDLLIAIDTEKFPLAWST
jgi:hypothetical protein